MQFNVSQLKDHRACARYHYNRHILRRGDAPDALPLHLGTLWHLSVAAKFCEDSEALARGEKLATAVYSATEEVRVKYTTTLLPLLSVVKLPKGARIIAIEEPLTLTLREHTLVGTPDSVIEWNGKLWHGQHKTLSASKPVDVYTEMQRYDWHECAYEWMIREKYPDREFGGTILIIARKLSAKAVAEAPERAVSVHIVSRPPTITTDALIDMLQEMNDIKCEVDQTRRITQNTSFCGGVYGNKLCEYFDTCFSGARVEDMPLMSSRYAEEQEV